MNLKYGPQILESTKDYIEELTLIGRYPSIAGLAMFLSVNKGSIKNWRKKYEDFDALVEKIIMIQEQRLCEMGLTGEWNATLVKFLLCNHGYGKNQDDDKDLDQKRQVNLYFNGVPGKVSEGTDKDSFTVTSEDPNAHPEPENSDPNGEHFRLQH